MKRVNFNYEHLNLLELQEEYRPLLDMDGVRFILKQLPQPRADAMTLVFEGRIIACMGYIQLLPGVAEVWLFPSIYVHDCKLSFVREVNRYLEAIADTFKWHRLQTVTQDIPAHREWMRTLGFEEEGRLKLYYQGQDYILSARFFDVKESL